MTDFLDKFKPKVSIGQTFDVPTDLGDKELAFDLLRKLVTARTIQDITFLAMGKILKVIRDKKLYRDLDYENFSQFLASEELSLSRESAYAYIRTHEIFVEQLGFNPDEIGKMGVVRLKMLAPLVKDTDDKDSVVKKIAEMQGLRYGDFVRQIKSETNTDGKPEVWYSKEESKWVINYHENITRLNPLGNFIKNGQEKEN